MARIWLRNDEPKANVFGIRMQIDADVDDIIDKLVDMSLSGKTRADYRIDGISLCTNNRQIIPKNTRVSSLKGGSFNNPILIKDVPAEKPKYPTPTSIAKGWYEYQRMYHIHFNAPLSTEYLIPNSAIFYYTLYASRSPNAVMYFNHFSEFSSSRNTSPKFIELAESVIRKMSIQYKSEALRKNALYSVLTDSGLFTLSEHASRAVSKGYVKSDLSVVLKSPNSNLNAVITNIEMKNDFGDGGKNLNRQQAGYYLHFSEAFLLDKNLSNAELAPMLLISIVGCEYIQAFGAYRNERNEPCIDAISPPLSLMYSSSDQFGNVELVGCFFQAAYNVIEALKIYYTNALDDSYVPRGGWPYFSYDNTIIYQEHPKSGVFFAQYKSEDVVLKFVHGRYGTEVHRCLERKQLAPKILALEELSCSWIVVMMERIPLPSIEMQDVSELPLSVRQEGAIAILDALKEGNYVHGDLRKPNMIYNTVTEKIVVLDYDLAGVEGSVTYPYGLNTRDIEWPEGVSAGVNVTAEHDRYMIYKQLDIQTV